MSEYRGLLYVLRPGGRGRWHWEVYRANSTVGFAKGRVTGMISEAVRAAESAIDHWLEKESQTVDLAAGGNLGRENAEKIWAQIRRLERLAQRTPHKLERRAHEASIAHLKRQWPKQSKADRLHRAGASRATTEVSDEQAEHIAFIDFEASSLGSGSFPTEIGWAFIAGNRVHSGSSLIRPEPRWIRLPSAWSAASERLTSITRDMLDREGVPADEALPRLLQSVDDRQLLSDEPAWDLYWLGQLIEAAGSSADKPLGNAKVVITEAAARLGRVPNWDLPIRHRAEADARRLAEIYARAMGIVNVETA